MREDGESGVESSEVGGVGYVFRKTVQSHKRE